MQEGPTLSRSRRRKKEDCLAHRKDFPNPRKRPSRKRESCVCIGPMDSLFRKKIAPWSAPVGALVFLTSLSAYPWGETGHRMVVQEGLALVSPGAKKACAITGTFLVDHVKDPDTIWKRQPWKYPKERFHHYFHVDTQGDDWKKRSSARSIRDGDLVYRIIELTEELQKKKKSLSPEDLQERLIGLTHYLGDLTQPMHLHHDADGKESGLAGIHSQYETKMVNRFEGELASAVKRRLDSERIPPLWKTQPLRDLIFSLAEQNSAKLEELYKKSRSALVAQRPRRGRSHPSAKPSFAKPILWRETADLTANQIAQGARLVGWVLESVCRE